LRSVLSPEHSVLGPRSAASLPPCSWRCRPTAGWSHSAGATGASPCFTAGGRARRIVELG